MLKVIFENGEFGILALLALAALILLHYFLFREYAVQGKIQRKRLIDMEQLVKLEIQRSQVHSTEAFEIGQMKAKTNEKLELIKLQVEAMKKREEMSKSD
jgi:hypothetical protein